jgi:LysM repeat protein
MANTTYQIKSGDTLSGIASKYGTTLSALLKANPNITDPNKIYAGASLYLPTAQSASPTPAPVSPTPTPTPIASSGAGYSIRSGDTLSAIARSQGTTIDELMRLNPNIKNPNLIYAGQSLTLPSASKSSASQDFSTVGSLQDANTLINQNQDQDAEAATISGEPQTRKTTEEIIAEITQATKPSTERPTANFEQSLQSYRTEYGVESLETQLNDLKAQEQEIYEVMRTRRTAEKGKTVATNVIEGRISEAEAQEYERLSVIQRSIANTTDQLNTKYKLIDSLMQAKQLDYNSAVADYDKEMSNNISIFNTAKNIEESQKSEIERAQDNARSSAQIALNAYASAGLSYEDLSATDKSTLTKLGVQSGLGSNFFSSILNSSSGKQILTTVVSADDTKATIIYKDGSTKTIATGLPAKTSTTTDKPTTDETKIFYKQSMESELQKIIGNDGYVSPTDWAKARSKWSTATPYDATSFDQSFRGFVNPAHPQDYAGYENYKANFIKKSSAELEAGE